MRLAPCCVSYTSPQVFKIGNTRSDLTRVVTVGAARAAMRGSSSRSNAARPTREPSTRSAAADATARVAQVQAPRAYTRNQRAGEQEQAPQQQQAPSAMAPQQESSRASGKRAKIEVYEDDEEEVDWKEPVMSREDWEDAVLCACCKSTNTTPTVVCANSHILCEPCARKISNLPSSQGQHIRCPTCRESLLPQVTPAPASTKNMMELIYGQQKCELGCGKLLRMSEIVEHNRVSCPNRTIQCPQCPARPTIDRFVGHMCQHHYAKQHNDTSEVNENTVGFTLFSIGAANRITDAGKDLVDEATDFTYPHSMGMATSMADMFQLKVDSHDFEFADQWYVNYCNLVSSGSKNYLLAHFRPPPARAPPSANCMKYSLENPFHSQIITIKDKVCVRVAFFIAPVFETSMSTHLVSSNLTEGIFVDFMTVWTNVDDDVYLRVHVLEERPDATDEALQVTSGSLFKFNSLKNGGNREVHLLQGNSFFKRGKRLKDLVNGDTTIRAWVKLQSAR